MRNSDDFDELEDLLPEGHLPLYGLRIVVVTDGDQRGCQICIHGRPEVETLLGMLDITGAIMTENFLGESDG